MKFNFLAGVIGTALLLSPFGLAQQKQDDGHKAKTTTSNDNDMQRAIAFQRAKDRADARQARLEERHPSVNYSNADRRMDDSTDANRVPDKGPQPIKHDK
jgi:hypothetical protein